MSKLPVSTNETTARVLALLSSMPGQELHTNEIIRRTGSLPNAAQRALTRSEAQGLIASRRVGNLRLWQMDPKNPLYAAIREMFARTRGVPARLAEVLRKSPRVKLAFLFGSYVTAQDDPTSDIDLFVAGEPDWVTLSDALRRAGREVGREVNTIVWGEKDLHHPLPTQKSFLDSVLAVPMMWLVGDRSELERIRAGLGPEVAGRRRGSSRRPVASGRAGLTPKGAGSPRRRENAARKRQSRNRPRAC